MPRLILAADSLAAGTRPISDLSLSPLLETTVTLVLAVQCLSMLMSLWRLMRGPSMADRVVALDLIGINIVGVIAVLAIATGEPTLLSVAIVLALVAFLGTVAFADYLRKGGQP
jgi:multicomponent Na+:H+ antiporter subunit F